MNSRPPRQLNRYPAPYRRRGDNMTEKMILHGKNPSPCCSLPTILVRSRDGGWVTQNCSEAKCGLPYKIVESELPDLRCRECDAQLTTFLRRNYFYPCKRCELEWELPLMLPEWHELFEYHGFG